MYFQDESYDTQPTYAGKKVNLNIIKKHYPLKSVGVVMTLF